MATNCLRDHHQFNGFDKANRPYCTTCGLIKDPKLGDVMICQICDGEYKYIEPNIKQSEAEIFLNQHQCDIKWENKNVIATYDTKTNFDTLEEIIKKHRK